MTIVSLLATSTISKGIDENGVEVDPSLEFTGQIIAYSKPYPCRIKPRSPAALALVADAVAE